jgi:tetratricopeptide (TPR) repeat protein
METEIAILQDIRSALWVLIIVVSIGVVAVVVRAIVTSYRAVKTEIDNFFYNSASAMYESGDLNELVKYCQEHLKKKPKEAYAYWFLGKAHFQMKELDKAEEYFNKAVEIYPSWEKEWIGPFLEKIAAARNSPLTNQPSSTR